MTIRVTHEEVQAIIVYDTTVITDITPYVTVASLLVDTCTSSALTDALKKEIERWLSAHFIAIADPRIKTEKADVVGATYQVKLGDGLRTTMYGQQACTLDVSGYLSGLSNPDTERLVSLDFHAVGTQTAILENYNVNN